MVAGTLKDGILLIDVVSKKDKIETE